MAALSVVVSCVLIVLLLAKGVESTLDQVLLVGAVGYLAVEIFNHVRLRGQRERANR